MIDDPEEVENPADAFEILNDLDGRDIIIFEMAEALSTALGVSLDKTDEIVHPASDLLPNHDEDIPVVSLDDLSIHILAGLGGDPTAFAPLMGRGTGADWIFEENYPRIKEQFSDE